MNTDFLNAFPKRQFEANQIKKFLQLWGDGPSERKKGKQEGGMVQERGFWILKVVKWINILIHKKITIMVVYTRFHEIDPNFKTFLHSILNKFLKL